MSTPSIKIRRQGLAVCRCQRPYLSICPSLPLTNTGIPKIVFGMTEHYQLHASTTILFLRMSSSTQSTYATDIYEKVMPIFLKPFCNPHHSNNAEYKRFYTARF